MADHFWRSFDCDGTIADFDGYADWSVVDRNTQPVDNLTPPVRLQSCDASLPPRPDVSAVQRFCGKLDTSGAVAGTAPLARFRLVRVL